MPIVLSVSPTSGPIGTTFTFSALVTGAPPASLVNVEIRGRLKGDLTWTLLPGSAQTLTADAAGTANYSYSSTLPGVVNRVYEFVAHVTVGAASGDSNIVTLTIGPVPVSPTLVRTIISIALIGGILYFTMKK